MTPRKVTKRRPHTSWSVWDNQSWQGENEGVSSKHAIPVCISPLFRPGHPDTESAGILINDSNISCSDYTETDKQAKTDPT